MKTNRYIVIALLLSIFVSSCEDGFLKQDPQTSLSSEQVFEKPENVQAFVYGLYYQWRATRVNRKGFYTILGTDEAQQREYQVRTNAMQAAFDNMTDIMILKILLLQRLGIFVGRWLCKQVRGYGISIDC